ncbi:hypothetical protein B0I27_10793 [Arcticibacter pallidicorallinus]|uniref:Uncharacterized protein n=1 Tax=Arcticibacter pallidicorallinus TaxID=1259464 RepID=A0A2T0U0Q6_9SPHI|nr:hypothetical protein B0I27_10793 [Arcticibacter pallidicorallinus]
MKAYLKFLFLFLGVMSSLLLAMFPLCFLLSEPGLEYHIYQTIVPAIMDVVFLAISIWIFIAVILLNPSKKWNSSI